MKGQVTRRADDPFGQGFGNVKTGFVSSQKLSFLQRASSVDRYDSRYAQGESSPTPSGGSGRGKGLRVTWAESPNGSRPGSNMGWTDRVAELDNQTMRAQTPPLAGEWAVSKGSNMETKAFTQTNQTNVAFESQSSASMGFSQFSSSTSADAKIATNGFSVTSGSQIKQASSFQSTQKSSFSSSTSFKAAQITQIGNISHTFEAFPGMGGIENLNLEYEKAGK